MTLGVCLSQFSLSTYVRGGSAVSPEAADVRKAAGAVVESAERSLALFGEKRAALSALIALAAECSEPDWDGQDAAAISLEAVDTAVDFVRVLPAGVPLPEFAVEPDGSIALDWTVSRHRRFTLSIGGSNRLAYAWLDGGDKGHGVARFDGELVPPRILDTIHSITGHADASLRAA